MLIIFDHFIYNSPFKLLNVSKQSPLDYLTKRGLQLYFNILSKSLLFLLSLNYK